MNISVHSIAIGIIASSVGTMSIASDELNFEAEKSNSNISTQSMGFTPAPSNAAKLGYSYETAEDNNMFEPRLIGNQIIRFPADDSEYLIKAGNAYTTVDFLFDANLRELEDQLTGRANITLGNIFEGEAQLDDLLKENDYSTSFSYTLSVRPYPTILWPKKWNEVTDSGDYHAVMNQNANDRYDRLMTNVTYPVTFNYRDNYFGNAYVNRLSGYAGLAVTIEILHKNKADKLHWKAAMGLSAGALDVSASFERFKQISENISSVKIDVKQYGVPEFDIRDILGDELNKSCTAANFNECFDVFNEAIQYARGSLGAESMGGKSPREILCDSDNFGSPEQLTLLDQGFKCGFYDHLRHDDGSIDYGKLIYDSFDVVRYDHSGMDEMLVVDELPAVKYTTDMIIDEIFQEYLQQNNDLLKVEHLLPISNSDDRTLLQNIEAAILANNRIFMEIGEQCFQNRENCIPFYLQEIDNLQDYSRRALLLM